MTKLDEKFNKGTRRQVKEYEKDFAKDVAAADEHLVGNLNVLAKTSKAASKLGGQVTESGLAGWHAQSW